MPRHSDAIKSAIKDAVDIVALVGEYLTLRRAGTKYKALCPFHSDHNPSLEVNPERQSYKCWSCGAGGDVFDFVMKSEHVDFPEALRMLADRAGIALERSTATAVLPAGPSKTDLLEVNAWAEEVFAKALLESNQVIDYLESRQLSRESTARFRLGYAPVERGWFLAQAKRKRYTMELLEEAGLISQALDKPGLWRERFRGRLIFPIHDERGRTLGFGGRILPEVEQRMAASGLRVAKYLNSPETTLFHKRTILYAADLARNAAREAGWLAVVEGYTDVIAAHQVGLKNVVGTLGTAFGEDHLKSLRRLADGSSSSLTAMKPARTRPTGRSSSSWKATWIYVCSRCPRISIRATSCSPKAPTRFATWPIGRSIPWPTCWRGPASGLTSIRSRDHAARPNGCSGS